MSQIKKNQANKHSLLRQTSVEYLDFETVQAIPQYKLHEIKNLTEDTFIMRFDKNGMKFRAGQHITLGIPGDNQVREYSIYSTEQDPFLEVLVKEVDKGIVSKKLHHCKPGDYLNVEGPFGFFTLDEEKMNREHLFIASGTGIAPFHSMAGSYPQINYTLLHGIRFVNETYESGYYPITRYASCITRDKSGSFHGRVTEYIRQYPVNQESMVYLCGNCDMIYDVYDILMSQNFPADQIKTEVYF